MKIAVILGGLLLALPLAEAAEAEVVAIAEQTIEGRRAEQPAPSRPAYYAEGIGGYIEAGFPIAGEKVPAAESIVGALRASLRTQGYFAATAEERPTLLITYHWGLVRGTVWPSLVAPQALVYRMRTVLRDRQMPGLGAVSADIAQTSELAAEDRYFIIVSAYEYRDVLQQTPNLLWRTKVSISDLNSVDDPWTTLAKSTAPYLGQDFFKRQIHAVRTPGESATESIAAGPTHQTGRAETDLIANLTRTESEFLAGDAVGVFDKNPPPLPPQLAESIRAYEQEKSALQSLLREKIKSKSPGPDFDRAIEAFDRDNSTRIASLGRMAEHIRGELAKLTPPSVASIRNRMQPLDRLRRSFDVDSRRFETIFTNPRYDLRTNK